MIKGAYRSRTIASIVAEAAELTRRGVREINLISQDTTFFGRDRGIRNGLVRLLQRLVSVPKLRWLRILYGYPEEITPDLLEVMREDKICAYLDLPFQHADREILRRMKRTMDGPQTLALLLKIRKALPGVAVRTSLIVGFPGEGRREFSRLKEFVREAQFEHLGVFTYSLEKGTSAYRLGDPIPEGEKIRRRDEIMEIQAGISASWLKKYVHRQLEILLDSPSPASARGLIGRARFQAPEVDGVVLIGGDQGLRRPLRAVEKVEIEEAEVYDLRGILVG
jgi:ribosomal protein S12 methylthiotransferase